MTEERKLVKKLSKSRFAVYEQQQKQSKSYVPVPEKFYVEDEGLAKAVGGGIEAFTQQKRRLIDYERMKADEIIARKLSNVSDASTCKSDDNGIAEDKTSIDLAHILQQEEELDEKAFPVADEKSDSLTPIAKNEIVKVINELNDLDLALNEMDFLQFALEHVEVLPYIKRQSPKEVKMFCQDMVRSIYLAKELISSMPKPSNTRNIKSNGTNTRKLSVESNTSALTTGSSSNSKVTRFVSSLFTKKAK